MVLHQHLLGSSTDHLENVMREWDYVHQVGGGRCDSSPVWNMSSSVEVVQADSLPEFSAVVTATVYIPWKDAGPAW